MKLTFKDLKQQRFTLDAELSDTIEALKQKIQAEKGWEASSQKLIYSGKILQDQNTVESYNIEEKGFIVCMVSKPKPSPAPATVVAESSSSAKTPTKVSNSASAQSSTAPPPAPSAPRTLATPATQNPPSTPSPARAENAPSSSSGFTDPSALALGAQRETAIENMLNMGFERAHIDRAMRAAFFNPDRAVEYLLSGIPEHLQREAPPPRQSQPQEASPPPVAAPNAGDPEPENVNLFEAAASAASQRQHQAGQAGGNRLGNLEFLRNNPQFQQLRQIVQQNPMMLEPILQQVSQGNPGLAALINQNQEAFLGLLAHSGDDDDDASLPPGTHHIAVTPEERDAIERLCRLGFDRDIVIQAYFACDKNEELAANFLFDQPPDADE